jgi:hypothetical protein
MVVGVEAAVSMSVLSAAEFVTIVAKAVVKKMGLIDSTSTAASSRNNNNNNSATLGMLVVSFLCFLSRWMLSPLEVCLWWLDGRRYLSLHVLANLWSVSQLNSSGGSMLLHD